MSGRRRYHAHIPGVIFVLATLFLGVGAYNSQNNLLFLFFGIAISSMLASGLISGAMLMGLRAERPALVRATAGERFTLRYRVRNTAKRVPAFAILIEEDDETGFSSVIERPVTFTPHVRAKGDAIAIATAVAHKRGEARLTRVSLTSRFPFGFMRKSIAFDVHTRVVVHPVVYELRRDALRAVADRSRGEAIDDRNRGVGGEFYALREYVPGDAVSHVAWRASARHGSLLVREETRIGARAYDLTLVLDPGDGPVEDNERAISLVASLANWAVRAGAPVSLDIPSHGVRLRRGDTPEHLVRLLDALAGIGLRQDPGPEISAAVPAPARGSHAIAVHASGVDPSRAPAGALHLRSADLDTLSIAREGADA